MMTLAYWTLTILSLCHLNQKNIPGTVIECYIRCKWYKMLYSVIYVYFTFQVVWPPSPLNHFYTSLKVKGSKTWPLIAHNSLWFLLFQKALSYIVKVNSSPYSLWCKYLGVNKKSLHRFGPNLGYLLGMMLFCHLWTFRPVIPLIHKHRTFFLWSDKSFLKGIPNF